MKVWEIEKFNDGDRYRDKEGNIYEIHNDCVCQFTDWGRAGITTKREMEIDIEPVDFNKVNDTLKVMEAKRNILDYLIRNNRYFKDKVYVVNGFANENNEIETEIRELEFKEADYWECIASSREVVEGLLEKCKKELEIYWRLEGLEWKK